MSDESTESQSGPDTMTIDTTFRWAVWIGGASILLGGAMLVYMMRHRAEHAEDFYTLVGCIGALMLFGVIYGPHRTGITADRSKKKLARTWGWFFLRGRREVPASQGPIHVEKSTRRSKEGGSTDVFEIRIRDVGLATLSESEDGDSRAPAMAKQLASFLGLEYGGVRDSPAQKKRDAWMAKNAHLPLMLVGVGAVVVVVIFLLTH